MASERIRIDRKDLQYLHGLFKKGRLDLQPSYQRDKVWTDEKKMVLIESIMDDYPVGLVIFNVMQKPDADGKPLEFYEVVDGQQRLTTLFEYLNGVVAWATVPKKPNASFKAFRSLSEATQDRIDQYQLPIAFLNEFDEEDITEVFSRLQNGMALKMGEKLKALTTGSTYPFVKQIAEHDLFDVDARFKVRANNWTLATTFMKAAFSKNPVIRVEFPQMKEFINTTHDATHLNKAFEESKKTLSYLKRVIKETQVIDPTCNFIQMVGTARTLKWIFVTIVQLGRSYALNGKEVSVARALIGYYDSIKVQNTKEWTNYLETGRTGRMDTEAVKLCLDEISGRIVNQGVLVPIDSKRSFTVEQRNEIFKASDGHCQDCSTEISATNFHADHITPHSKGGRTDVINGQALCSACNTKKGNLD
jgi:hypothetical protein